MREALSKWLMHTTWHSSRTPFSVLYMASCQERRERRSFQLYCLKACNRSLHLTQTPGAISDFVLNTKTEAGSWHWEFHFGSLAHIEKCSYLLCRWIRESCCEINHHIRGKKQLIHILHCHKLTNHIIVLTAKFAERVWLRLKKMRSWLPRVRC